MELESIKHIDDKGNEYWIAREVSKKLKYQYRNFYILIKRARRKCKKAGESVPKHFINFGLEVELNYEKRKVVDCKLSKYACNLILESI